MKKSLALFASILMVTSVHAAGEYGSPQVGLLPEAHTSANIASPIVIPEPTAATLLMVSAAACGLRIIRKRRTN